MNADPVLLVCPLDVELTLGIPGYYGSAVKGCSAERGCDCCSGWKKIQFPFRAGRDLRPGLLCEAGRRVIWDVRPQQLIAKVDGPLSQRTSMMRSHVVWLRGAR